MIDLVKNAGVDWTIVRFTAPKDTPKTGKLRVGFYGTDRIGFAVSRADIAAFTAKQVDDHTYLNPPALSN
jgi:NAD(P)H-binding